MGFKTSIEYHEFQNFRNITLQENHEIETNF